MHLHGIYAPIITPFDAGENINYAALEQLVDFLLVNGISGLTPGGTTGEVYALNDAERSELFRFIKDKVAGRAMLIAGVNAGATRDVIGFARLAEQLGYDAVMVAVPPYSRPNQVELLAHFKVVAQSTGLPVLLYNFPWRAGSEVGFGILDGLLEQPNVIGIKEASSDMTRVYEMRLRYGERYQIVCGSDDQALDYFLWGASCWLGGGASCAPQQHAAVLQAAQQHDFSTARIHMTRLLPLLRSLESGGYIQKAKYGCELLGIPAGPPRRPLLPLPAEERPEFERVFRLAWEAAA